MTILARFWASSSRAAQTGLLCSVAALPSTHSACSYMETGQFFRGEVKSWTFPCACAMPHIWQQLLQLYDICWTWICTPVWSNGLPFRQAQTIYTCSGIFSEYGKFLEAAHRNYTWSIVLKIIANALESKDAKHCVPAHSALKYRGVPVTPP